MRPKDVHDLSVFLAGLDPATPVLPVGVGSNLIVRDGGVPGVVVRLPKAMAKVVIEPGNTGACAVVAAMGIHASPAPRAMRVLPASSSCAELRARSVAR